MTETTTDNDETPATTNKTTTTTLAKEDTPYFNREHGVAFDCWLNLYHGMKIDESVLEHYTTMTTVQKELYESFVEQVKSIDWKEVEGIDPMQPILIPDQWTCLRFLQADKYDADAAYKRLQATQAFHHQYHMSRIVSGLPMKLNDYRKLRRRAYMGLDNDGMPVFCERLGHFMSAITSNEGQALSDNDYIECFLYDIGLVFSEIRKSYQATCDDESIPTKWKVTWIMDAADMRYYRGFKSMPTLRLLDSILEPNFPELSGPIYVINVPTIAYGFMKLAKAFLDPSVTAKIQLFSGVPTELLLTRMKKEVLLEEYGGTNMTTDFPKAEYTM